MQKPCLVWSARQSYCPASYRISCTCDEREEKPNGGETNLSLVRGMSQCRPWGTHWRYGSLYHGSILGICWCWARLVRRFQNDISIAMTGSIGRGTIGPPMTQVELTISCKNLKNMGGVLSKSNPMVVLFKKDLLTGNFTEIARTEHLENTLNPEFARKITVDYYFEEHQKLKFRVYEVKSESPQLSAHDFLGFMECSLGEIVGAVGAKLNRQLIGRSERTNENWGSIQVLAEELNPSQEMALIQLRAFHVDKKDLWGTSDPFFLLYRINDDNTETLAYRSEYIKYELSPVWKPFKVTLQQLCNCNPEKPIRIDCYDHDFDGGHDFIGSTRLTFADLKKFGESYDVRLINPVKKAKKKCSQCIRSTYKNSGVLRVMQCQVRVHYSFLEYMMGGTELHFTVAVDFTASNGTPSKSSSLHYIDSRRANQYQMALRAVGDIIADYSSDKLFPAFGFGARMPLDGKVSHKFHMNFLNDPTCTGVEGIMKAYQKSINQVELYGPTNFSPVIRHVAETAASSGCDGVHYFILLIITDGIICDFEETKKAIVEAAGLPMSIIIVGVGNDDFEAMDVLDGDNIRVSYMGTPAERDMVQFVPFRDFIRANDCTLSQAALAREVLFELPTQLTEWMDSRRIIPIKRPRNELYTGGSSKRTLPAPLPSEKNQSHVILEEPKEIPSLLKKQQKRESIPSTKESTKLPPQKNPPRSLLSLPRSNQSLQVPLQNMTPGAPLFQLPMSHLPPSAPGMKHGSPPAEDVTQASVIVTVTPSRSQSGSSDAILDSLPYPL